MKLSRWNTVLGMNARTLLVQRENPQAAIRLVNDKQATKEVVSREGVPVVPTLALIRNRRELASFDWESLPDAWAVKPNLGARGAGIMLARERTEGGWLSPSGRVLTPAGAVSHVLGVLDGEYSMAQVERDTALFEPLVVPDPQLGRLAPSGLPDIRVICHHSEPALAMVRLPTHASDGRANLHQGAVGAGIDLETGRIMRARHQHAEITNHPDTGMPVVGTRVPYWEQVLEAARACGRATGLGYMGVDVVIDQNLGPVVMEVNARPGLEIQNITGTGISKRLAELDRGRETRPIPFVVERTTTDKAAA